MSFLGGVGLKLPCGSSFPSDDDDDELIQRDEALLAREDDDRTGNAGKECKVRDQERDVCCVAMREGK